MFGLATSFVSRRSDPLSTPPACARRWRVRGFRAAGGPAAPPCRGRRLRL